MFDIVETNSEVSDDKFNKMSIQHIFLPQLQLSTDEAKQFLLMVRALSFHVSLQYFTVIFFCPLEAMGDIFHAVELEGMVQLAICSFNENEKVSNSKLCLTICFQYLLPQGKKGELNETANDMVIL